MSSYKVAYGGERLDRIAKKLYGSEQTGTVEALLLANPGLADHGAIISEGTLINVPLKVETPSTKEYVLAWE